MNTHEDDSLSEVTRRQFLVQAGLAGFTVVMGVQWLFPGNVLAIPNADGFLLVDLKKCQGCGTCMMTCSLAHTGEASYTLSRIQIQQDSFKD